VVNHHSVGKFCFSFSEIRIKGSTVAVKNNFAKILSTFALRQNAQYVSATAGTAITPVTITNAGLLSYYSISPAISNGLSFNTSTGTISVVIFSLVLNGKLKFNLA
jgi:hypothetical protein